MTNIARINLSLVRFYTINLLCVWLLVALLYGISLVHISIYYLLLGLSTLLILNDCWNESSKDEADRIDQLIYAASVLWVFVHALAHINTCYTTELMRGNQWLDIIVHFMSTILTLAAYFKQQSEKSKESQLQKCSGVLDRCILPYLVFVSLFCFLSIYVSMKYVRVPEDGDRLALWWAGAGLSFVNFSTMNIYRMNIFSSRFLVDLLHGLLVFLVQVTKLISVQTFVTTHYFETYLIAALLFQKLSRVDQWKGFGLSASITEMSILALKRFYQKGSELVDVLQDYVEIHTNCKGVRHSSSGSRHPMLVVGQCLLKVRHSI